MDSRGDSIELFCTVVGDVMWKYFHIIKSEAASHTARAQPCARDGVALVYPNDARVCPYRFQVVSATVTNDYSRS